MAALPSTGASLATLVRLTLRRFARGRGAWLAIVFAALPVTYAAASHGKHRPDQELLNLELLVACVIQALLVAASIGEEIEDRTTTYLWSRPLPRWTILVGKLVALAPVATVLVVASTYAAVALEYDVTLPAGRALGLGAGTLAIGVVVAGIATVVPKHGMALAIVYLGIDLVIGNIPWSLQIASVTHQTAWLVGHAGDATALIALAVISAAWLAIALVRVRRLES